MKHTHQFILKSFLLLLYLPLCAQDYKINEIQVIGSHNSYKSKMAPEILEYLADLDRSSSKSLEYAHIPIMAQLDMGLRNLELDVFHDPLGGRYANPKGLDIISSKGGNTSDFDTLYALTKPGLKLFHVQDLDFYSHHLLFADALSTLRAWSENNPDHSPVFILINAKDGNIPGTQATLPFTSAALDSIDLEIRLHLGLEHLITPDLVRGSFKDLETAVLSHNWPSLNQAKGKFLFVLDENEEKTDRYLAAKPELRDAVLFVNKKEGHPTAGFRIINDPIKNTSYIQELVKKGYIIRTRADADTQEARNDDYFKLEKAKESGAQVISTDYYLPSSYFPSTYQVSFDGGVFERVNPILFKSN